jgi:hypothetical protein
MFSTDNVSRNQNFILRPETSQGKFTGHFGIRRFVHVTLQLSCSNATGWEFHAYLIQKNARSCTIYEPTDAVTQPLCTGAFGIRRIKEAYEVHITKRM